jgi:hypothetical protein
MNAISFIATLILVYLVVALVRQIISPPQKPLRYTCAHSLCRAACDFVIPSQDQTDAEGKKLLLCMGCAHEELDRLEGHTYAQH